MSKEYIFELGDALYNEETGEVCFNPVIKGELVRCKDCKWWDVDSNNIFCEYGRVPKDDWFCADGEKQDE